MRRVVVTGYGAVSPCGLCADASWRAIKEGRSGIGPITSFDASEFSSRIAGECTGFDPGAYMGKRAARALDRFIHFAIAAADEAVGRAGLGAGDAQEEAFRERTGVLVGVAVGGLPFLEAMSHLVREKGPRRISPYFVSGTIGNLAPGQIAMRHRLRGINYAPASACTSGAHAIGEAFRAIARGELEGCLAGGAEAVITPLGLGGFAAMHVLSRRNDAPAEASRPWDRDRDGFVIAEGAGLLFLEARDHAVARGATIYAEVVGYGASADAYHAIQPAPDGEGAQRSMRSALQDARLHPEQIDYINAHGTSTSSGDLLELRAIRHVFGAHVRDGLWVSSTKSSTGHLLGAAGGLEAVLSVLALRDGVVPPTLNLAVPDDEAKEFDLVPHESRPRRIRYVLSNSFGFGGTNAALIFAA